MIEPEILIDTGQSQFWVIPNYTPDYYQHLKDLPVLKEPPILIFGKWRNQRRDIAFFSDESQGYQYSGQLMHSTPLNTSPLLQQLLPAINQSLSTNFNGILLNKYQNGEKYLGSHSDDESGLDRNNRMVAGLSYGPGVRKFRIRDKQTNKIVLDYQQHPGTLVVMQGAFQDQFKHEIPIEKRVKGERISLTFRNHIE
jgi:alkylated DNA repair dioxygenase AlkB